MEATSGPSSSDQKKRNEARAFEWKIWKGLVLTFIGLIATYFVVGRAMLFSAQPSEFGERVARIAPLEWVVLLFLLGLTVVALVEVFKAKWILVLSSRRLTRAEANPAPWTTLLDSQEGPTTWFDEALESARSRAIADLDARTMTWRNSAMPLAADVLETTRQQADRAGLLFRWFSTAAVLVGLMGTLVGLIDAIGNAILTLGAGAQIDGEALKGAMRGLHFCFVSSILGVATSFFLGFLRHRHESSVGIFFGRLEFALQSRLPDFYADPPWEDPQLAFSRTTSRFLETAEKMADVGNEIRKVGERIEALSNRINQNTSQILQKTVEFFSDELQKQLPKIAKTTEEGLERGVESVLTKVNKREEELRNELNQQQIELRDRLTTVITKIETTSTEFLDAVKRLAGEILLAASKQADEHRAAAKTVSDEALNALKQAAEGLLEATKAETAALKDAGSTVSTAVEHLGAAVEGFPSHLESQRAQLDRLTGQIVDTYSSSIGAAASLLQGSFQDLTTKLDADRLRIEGLLAGIGQTYDQLETQLKVTVKDTLKKYVEFVEARESAVREHMEAVRAEAATLDAASKRGVGELKEILDRSSALEEQSKRSVEALSAVTDALTKVPSALRELNTDLSGLASQIKGLVELDHGEAESFRVALDQMRRALDEFASSSARGE